MIEIEKVWLTEDAIWIRTKKGAEACERFADYPKLREATPEQRTAYITDPFGISWPQLDEDHSYDGFFSEKPELFRFFLQPYNFLDHNYFHLDIHQQLLKLVLL